MKDKKLNNLITQLALPDDFINYIPQYFEPIAANIHQLTQQGDTPVIGINGTQGSGKSTAAVILQLLLEIKYAHRVVVLSIDDFYHSKIKRSELAQTIHPLFITRGVPGTHDVDLAIKTITSLKDSSKEQETLIPRFDKAADDRKPEAQWELFKGPASVIIFEGWCVGATAVDSSHLIEPINDLERSYDSKGIWRRSVNNFLAKQYQQLFSQINWLLMLKAPSFEQVYEWRLLQEQKLTETLAITSDTELKSTPIELLSEVQLQRFIQHYQRITEHCLVQIPVLADAIIHLNKKHKMINLKFNLNND